MPAGLQVFDAAGNLVFNTNDYLGRIVGSFAIGKADGSVNIPGLTGIGTPFFIWLSNGDGSAVGGNPAINNSGDTIYWTYGTLSTGFRNSGTIFYGVK